MLHCYSYYIVTHVTLLHVVHMLQATDALEIMLLSLVGPVFQCYMYRIVTDVTLLHVTYVTCATGYRCIRNNVAVTGLSCIIM